MRKITRSDLDEMAETMRIIPISELSFFVGGYDENDCVWHCMAYIEGCGNYDDEDNARNLAIFYHNTMGEGTNGTCFDNENYAFEGTGNQLKTFISQYIKSSSTYIPSHIAVFDPSKVAGWTGKKGVYHAIIITGADFSNYSYYCPQTKTSGTVNRKELEDATKFSILPL